MQFSAKSFVLVFLAVAVILLGCNPVWAATIPNDNSGFMDSLSTGFRFATKLLGMNQSASVANLVSQAFSAPKIANKQSQPHHYEDSEYSSDDKDNYVVVPDKEEPNFASQFSSILGGGGAEQQQQQQVPSGTTTTTTTPSSPSASLSGIASILRVLGMDEKKLSALMVNGLIFIAQMVKNGASFINQKLSPVKQAFQRLLSISRLPTVTFAKID